MIEGVTDNGVKYDSYVTGPQGARFELYPISGFHTKEDVEAAQAQLRREQDVVKTYVIWHTYEAWKDLKVFLHPVSSMNNCYNQEYHDQFEKKMVGLSSHKRERTSKASDVDNQ